MTAHSLPSGARRRIRFWVYIHCPVKITLAPGDRLHHSYSYCNGEGWTRTSREWEHRGDRIVERYINDGTDCDGRLTRAGTSWFAPGAERLGYEDEVDGTVYPLWLHGKSHQRDYSAEAMGY